MARKKVSKYRETLTAKRVLKTQTIPLRDKRGYLWRREQDLTSYVPKLVFCPTINGLQNKNKCFTCEYFAAMFKTGVKCNNPKPSNPPYYYNRYRLTFQIEENDD